MFYKHLLVIIIVVVVVIVIVVIIIICVSHKLTLFKLMRGDMLQIIWLETPSGAELTTPQAQLHIST